MMNYFIYAPLFVLFITAVVDFAGRMTALWNRQNRSKLTLIETEPLELPTATAEPLEITQVVEPMVIGEPVELTVVVPEKKKDLIQFIKDHELQSKVYELTGATYSNSKVNKLPVLRKAVEMAIA